MDYYCCENPACGFLAQEEPEQCPLCGGVFFTPLVEEELTGMEAEAVEVEAEEADVME